MNTAFLLIGDLLLFITTSLVFSITCLCVVLQIRSKDRNSRGFLTILVPLTLQMGLAAVMTYLNRVLPAKQLTGGPYAVTCLLATFSSIILTSLLLFTLSRYLVGLLPEKPAKKRADYIFTNVIILLFLFISLFSIFFMSKGDWIYAMNLTLGYHFLCGSFLMASHGIASLFYIRKAHTREEESLLKGISVTFLPLLIFFPLDMLFLKNHSFRLAYVSFSVLVVYLYFFISRNYFRSYENPGDDIKPAGDFLSRSDLSQREQEIAILLIEGHTNADIGEKLFISVNTVKSHIKSIYKKLHVGNRVRLMHLVREAETNR